MVPKDILEEEAGKALYDVQRTVLENTFCVKQPKYLQSKV